jgi:hypothetical protein
MISSKLETNEHLKCPECKKTLDGITGKVTIPVEDDLSVCLYCHTPLIFKGKGMGLRLHKLDTDTMDRLKKEEPETWQQLQQFISIAKSI